MSGFEIPQHIAFQDMASPDAPPFNVPVLPEEARKLADAWQILLHDSDDRQLHLTKWHENGSIEGHASVTDATQFDLRFGVRTALQKAAYLKEMQDQPDKLYIINADRTTIAQITLAD